MKHKFSYIKNLGFTESNGLVTALKKAKNNQERLYIKEAQSLGADAVFFRRFYKSQSNGELENCPFRSIPTVCIFDKEDNFFNTQPHKELHAALWSSGQIDIYIVLGETRLDIINARQPAKRIQREISLRDAKLHLVSSSLKEFNDNKYSAHLFSSGTFWEQEGLQEKIDSNNSPYLFLLRYLMQAREQLLSNPTSLKLAPSCIDKLLITSILIKFLEEIKDDNGKHTLKEIYRLYQIESFEEALNNGKCLLILNELSKEFNGKIFNTFTNAERQSITEANLVPIAQFLSANIDIDTQQFFLWEQYDFKYLPAEIISALYETFIQEEAARQSGKTEKGVVYTPVHLVNLMVDEAMPLERPDLFENNQYKILDPACGSGVFLVAAYKRLLQWWTINKYKKTGEIRYPNKTIAQKILEDNIFGVDIVNTAVLVSIFGLTTALLDKLTPKEIWNHLKFQDLSQRNIQEQNFSDWAKTAKTNNEKFDLVIGNPPFNKSSLGDFTNDDFKELFKKQVPGNKLALKFLEAALHFGDRVCMIIPSNVFLYNKNSTTQKYRKSIFTNYTVSKIYDFTHLRRELFHKTADTPVITLLIDKTPNSFQPIEHIIVKRAVLSEKKIRFEIDYYDHHSVRWEWATDEKKQFVWKTNLLGGGRLFHLIYRLSLLKDLNFFLKEKSHDGWIYSNGYISQFGKIEKNKQVSFLNNQLRIKSKTFNSNGEFETEIIPQNEYFWSVRKKELYTPPIIIFKLVLEKTGIPIAYVKDYLCFNSSFVGISSSPEDEKALLEVYDRISNNKIISKLYQAYILATSPKAAVYHETSIIKDDIDNLPYPEETKYLYPSWEEQLIIDDLLNYYRHLGKAITKNSAGKALHTPITHEELKDFGAVFCETLNPIYAKNNESWQAGKIEYNDTFISYQFGFGQNNGLKNEIVTPHTISTLNLLENKYKNAGIAYQRIIRYYEHHNGYDCVYLIKPRNKRYWLRSIALKDADDTFIELKKAGY